MAYSIGNPLTGEKQEAQFEELEDAEIAALEKSIDDSLWGVWMKMTANWYRWHLDKEYSIRRWRCYNNCHLAV